MKFSFPRFFKKEKAADSSVSAPEAAPAPIEKPASQRLGKTVMPNMARVVAVENVPQVVPVTPAPAAATPPAISPAPRTISLGEKRAPVAAPQLAPPEVAGVPVGGRTVALPLTDLLPQIPAELLETSAVDPAHRIVFNAAALERGMANGRPAVPLHSIYQQAPTLFASAITAEDEREIALPFQAVLQQFANLQVRPDQVTEATGPEVETPFSKATIEDSERFGTPLAPLPTTATAPPPAPAFAPPPAAKTIAPEPRRIPAPPPAPSVAPAPAPMPAAQLPPLAPIRLPMPPQPSAPPLAKLAPSQPAVPPPTIPPLAARKISPNGTGVPATERVPASSGPPVPIPLPAPFAPPPPARIPFKITPPASDLCPPPPLPVKAEATPIAFSTTGPRIHLSLRAILRELPPFQFTGALEEIAEDAQIELPFAIVEPQLSLGRIAVSPAQFQAAMPEKYRPLFHLDVGGLPIALPLPEVLENLPNESLQLRSDQQEAVVVTGFETPFSQKAAEDAARLNVPAAPVAEKPATVAEPEKVAPVVAAEATIAPEPAVAPLAPAAAIIPPLISEEESAPAPVERTPLQLAFETDEPLDAKAIVAHTSRLPGVSACAIVFSDGLSLAGNIPSEYEVDALCAMAPTIMKRIDDQMSGTNLGELDGVTLYCAKVPVSFFAHGNICLAALHSAGGIASEIRGRLGRVTEELARMYA